MKTNSEKGKPYKHETSTATIKMNSLIILQWLDAEEFSIKKRDKSAFGASYSDNRP